MDLEFDAIMAERRAAKADAEAAGMLAAIEGLPMLAPDYDREQFRAAWRIGWRKGRAMMGVVP